MYVCVFIFWLAFVNFISDCWRLPLCIILNISTETEPLKLQEGFKLCWVAGSIRRYARLIFYCAMFVCSVMAIFWICDNSLDVSLASVCFPPLVVMEAFLHSTFLWCQVLFDPLNVSGRTCSEVEDCLWGKKSCSTSRNQALGFKLNWEPLRVSSDFMS